MLSSATPVGTLPGTRADVPQGLAREMDHVASLKPEQYAVLLPGVSLREAGETAERLRPRSLAPG